MTAAELPTEAAESRPPPLARLAAATAGLAGWRRYGLAALLGLAAALAFEPFNLTLLLLPAFTGLVWLTDGAARRRAVFATGWWFGLGHFALGLYWVALSFLVEPEKYGWMVPFVVLGLSAGLALFPGLATLLAALARGRGAGRVLYLAVAWTAVEWLRGHVLTGFPWNLMGNVWTVSEETMQAAALFGVYGLSLITVLIAALPATLGDPLLAAGGRATGGRAASWRATPWRASGAAALMLAALWGGGAARLATAEDGSVPGVRLRLVQPNIPQALKWRRDLREAHFAELIEMSRGPGFETLSAVIWPETAAPYFLAQSPRRRFEAAAAAPPGGVLITGALRAEPRTEQAPPRYWNSLLALAPSGEIVATYDKHHLVPFGEYVPLRKILPIEKITSGRTDFSPGPGPRTLVAAGLPGFSPLVCYEVIFPGRVLDPARRPGWLLNITNDAWFGASSGPYQHFASARMRAVEEGVPLVRAANTGISAVVDSYGRVLARIGLNRKGVLDAPLPKAIFPVTLYGRLGDSVLLALLIIASVAGFFTTRQGKTAGGGNPI